MKKSYSYQEEKKQLEEDEIKLLGPRKSPVEFAYEKSLTKNKIEIVKNAAEFVRDNADEAFSCTVTLVEESFSVLNIDTQGIGEIKAEIPAVTQAVHTVSNIVSKFSTAVLVLYIGMQLYEEWNNDIAQVLGYN